MSPLVRSAMGMLYPRAEGFPGVLDCELDAFLERFRREAAPLMWLGVVAGALLLQLSPVFTVYAPLPAFLLSRRLQDLHAHRISNSSIYLVRQSIFLLKVAAGLAWGADPRVRERFALGPLPPDPGTWRAR